MSTRNVLLVDWDPPEPWSFRSGLETASGEPWEIKKKITNRNHGNAFRSCIRYLQYAFFSLRMFFCRKGYRQVLAWQQFFGLFLAFYCRLFHVRRAPAITVMTFIYKPKRGLAGRLYGRFVRYAVTSRFVRKILVYSREEVAYYASLFGLPEERFAAVRLGEEDMTERIPAGAPGDYCLSCGRSNRDYSFLLEHWSPSQGKLKIICDDRKLAGSDSVEIYSHCHGDAYYRMLAQSYAVIIPLEDEHISSGQLVMIQAMMYGKPCIVTRNKTVTDYIVDGKNGFVIPKEREALVKALERLRDPAVWREMSAAAREMYVTRFSAGALGDAVGRLVATGVDE